MAKKITTGVEKAYYAVLTTDGDSPTYETAKYLPGLREISVTANEEQATMYAENRLYDSEKSGGECLLRREPAAGAVGFGHQEGELLRSADMCIRDSHRGDREA